VLTDQASGGKIPSLAYFIEQLTRTTKGYMTDHEGITASMNPKMTDQEAIKIRETALQNAIDSMKFTLRVLYALLLLIILAIAVFYFGPEIHAWRLPL
jgi:hypothetical protein